jgi:transposase-like protein
VKKKLEESKQSRGSEARRHRRSFSPEFKREAVRLLEERRKLGVSVTQVGRELNIRPDVLRRWTREAGGSLASAAAQANGGSADDEVRRLRRENETLRQERDFLKKAAAFFAKESR